MKAGMEIVRYTPEMSRDLAAVYHDAVRGVPHCYPVSDDAFAEELAAAGGEGEGQEGLHSEAVFVAREGRRPLGFVHVGIEGATEDRPEERGAIRFLCYPRGQRRAGQDLLGAAEAYARERSVPRIVAFPQGHRYRFYHFKNAFLSDRLDHVQALLAFNGYERSGGEVFLDWPNYEPAAPVAPEVEAEFQVEQGLGRGRRPGLRVWAHRDGKQLGECICVSVGDWHDADEAQDWIFTNWLGVEGEVQGKGLGRHLLQRALQEARGLGYRHAAISTEWTNHRALLFYSNYGYHVVDWTYGFARKLA
jgi:GNAT superfamily N-acetyltransferase